MSFIMEKSCKFCGKTFDSRNQNALFCSGRCRKAANRRIHAIQANPGGAFEGEFHAARFDKLQMHAPECVAILVQMIKRHGEAATRAALEVAYVAAFPHIDRSEGLQALNTLLADENRRLYAKIAELTKHGNNYKV
jgi:hypothetical protein